MEKLLDVSDSRSPAVTRATFVLWTASIALAGLGSWLLFAALPGINWMLWTTAAVFGLLLFCRQGDRTSPSLLFIRFAPIVIAGGAAITASEQLWVWIAISGTFYLATQLLLATGLSTSTISVRLAALAPPVALRIAVAEAMRRGVDATYIIRSKRARAWARGLAITIPVLIAFALLLSNADPIFAAWRDAITQRFTSWDATPRLVFFSLLLVIALGAFGSASREAEPRSIDNTSPTRWLGSTERLMLFAGVAGLLWLFVSLQVSYLFGNLPQDINSGLTFAEHARRGFGELSVVASASGLLVIVSQRYGIDDGRQRTLRLLTFGVIEAVVLLLVSAFRRVLLYEAAYGFTTDRLYAQVYMCAVAVGLVLLAREVAGDFDAGRLFRRAAVSTTLLFVGLIYWNHEAWIANRNIDRLTTVGVLDVSYLTTALSPAAVPAIIQRLPTIPEPLSGEIRAALLARYAERDRTLGGRWFEWNLARRRARLALSTLAATA